MKSRREARGIHLYDRVSGLHVLLDEFPQTEIDSGPAVLSVALTNACDLACSFCYAPKSAHALNPSDVARWAKEFSTSGTIEIAFGGGEPTLYPQLTEVLTCTPGSAQKRLGFLEAGGGRDGQGQAYGGADYLCAEAS